MSAVLGKQTCNEKCFSSYSYKTCLYLLVSHQGAYSCEAIPLLCRRYNATVLGTGALLGSMQVR